jgi:MHS family proline/betaine transporter-like MFS transporter
MLQKRHKSIIYAVLGHVYEHYESTLFAFFGPLIAFQFFPPAENSKETTLGVYAAIAAGFWMRPFGATVFSWVGDKYGRRKAVIYSFASSIIPAIVIAILPGYDTLGFYSPVILIICRLFQGASIGGAFYGTITFVGESSPKHKKNINTGVLLSMGFLGALLGTSISAGSTMKFMPDWAWRIPFLFGAVYGILLFVYKGYMQESETWKKSEKSKFAIPFFHAIMNYPRNITAVFLFGSALLVPFYIAASWMSGHIKATFYLDDSYVLLLSSIMMLICGVFMVLFCWIATYFCPKKLLYYSFILNLVIAVLFYIAISYNSLSLLIVCQSLIAVLTALQGGPVFLIIQKMFPPKYKYSGFAVPFSIGQALFTGATPYISEKIALSTADNSNITYMIVLSMVLIFIGTKISVLNKKF